MVNFNNIVIELLIILTIKINFVFRTKQSIILVKQLKIQTPK